MSTLRVGNITATGGTGTITVPTGNQIVQTGAVLQVVQTVKSDTFSTTSTSFTDVTGLSVSITPASTSNRILVMVDVKIGGVGFSKLLRGSTDIYVGDAAGSRVRTNHFSAVNAGTEDSVVAIFLDSPATTSSTTYKIQIRGEAGANVRVNRSENDVDNSTTGSRTASSITVMEIAG